jgi:hypothetical protein
MSDLTEPIGDSDLYDGANYTFVSDRFDRPKSAIYFNKGYLKVPPGIYFSTNFTLIAWIRLNSYQRWSRIIDFGNGPGNDNIIFGFKESAPQLTAWIFKGKLGMCLDTPSTTVIQLGVWYHVSYVVQGQSWFIYVNGLNVAKGTYALLNNIVRASNFIGKSNFAADSLTDAVYDDIRIYQGAFKSSDIFNDYIKTTKLLQVTYWPGMLIFRK